MNRNKTTGHIFIGILVLLAVATGPVAFEARAAELELTTSNDIISGEDDLYTAEIGMRFVLAPRLSLELGERIFTDRDAGSRFDESYMRLETRLPPLAGWHGELRLGALHVGEGVGGQSLQNSVHRAVGSDRVDLAYTGEERWYPTLGLAGRRFLGQRSGAALFTRGELDATPGFRSSLQLALAAERPLAGDWVASGELGLRADHVEDDRLEEHVDGIAPAVRLGISYRRFSATWSWNEYGTETGHVTLGYRLGVGRVSVGEIISR